MTYVFMGIIIVRGRSGTDEKSLFHSFWKSGPRAVTSEADGRNFAAASMAFQPRIRFFSSSAFVKSSPPLRISSSVSLGWRFVLYG